MPVSFYTELPCVNRTCTNLNCVKNTTRTSQYHFIQVNSGHGFLSKVSTLWKECIERVGESSKGQEEGDLKGEEKKEKNNL